MSNLVRSTISPAVIEADVVRSGSVRLLCHWDIREVKVDDETGPRIEYEYAEKVLWWALPSPDYITRGDAGRQQISAAGRAYLDATAEEILGYAAAAGA